MPTLKLKTCHGCQRRVVCRTDRDGYWYCQGCYGDLARSVCTDCGGGIRYTSTTPPERCRRCERSQSWKGLACSRCNAIADAKGTEFEGRVFCRKCRHHAGPDRNCAYCPYVGPRLHRSPTAGLDQPACQTCISRYMPICGVCKGKRKLVGEVQGQPACKGCTERGTLLVGTCAHCGRHDEAANSKQCRGCWNLRHAHAVRKKASFTLEQAWVKDLFHAFTEHAGIQKQPGCIVTLIKRNIEGFQRIDREIIGVEALNVTSTLHALTVDDTNRKFRVIKHYLGATLGLDFDGKDAEQFYHNRKIEKLSNDVRAQWIRVELENFYARLQNDRARRIAAGVQRAAVPMKLSSLLLAMKYARWLMESCETAGANSTLQINQTMLDEYVVTHTMTYHTLGSFIRHLNRDRARFSPLELPPRRSARSSIHLRSSEDKRATLVRDWLTADNGIELRNSAVALLCMFYLQKPTKILGLRQHHIRREAEKLFLDFGHGWEEIDPEITAVLVRWLDAWHHHSRFKDIAGNDFLFPGTRPDRGYSSAAFSDWLINRHGLGCRQLFATSLHGLIEAGLNDPGAMVYQFGIRPGTAIRYWKDSGRDLGSFLFAEAIQTMRESGDLSFD